MKMGKRSNTRIPSSKASRALPNMKDFTQKTKILERVERLKQKENVK